MRAPRPITLALSLASAPARKLASGLAFALTFALAFAAAGCANECQQLCDEMADYAAECDLEWARDDIKECKSNQANRNFEDPKSAREACADALPTVRDEWTCDDLEDYFDDADSSDGSAESEE